jgi:rod shape-determining protein MreC
MGMSSIWMESAWGLLALWIKRTRPHLGVGFTLCTSLLILGTSVLQPEKLMPARAQLLDINAWLEASIKKSLSIIPTLGHMIQTYRLAASDYERLQAQNQTLNGWQHHARLLQRENDALRAQLRMPYEERHYLTTARVLGQWQNTTQHKLLLQGGIKDGLGENLIVITGRTLIGYIQTCGQESALVTTVRDPAVRIPVVGERSKKNAVVAGQGTNTLVLVHAQDQGAFMNGELLLTSPQGNFYPPGYVVGRVRQGSQEGALTLVLEASPAAPEYVTILKEQRSPKHD